MTRGMIILSMMAMLGAVLICQATNDAATKMYLTLNDRERLIWDKLVARTKSHFDHQNEEVLSRKDLLSVTRMMDSPSDVAAALLRVKDKSSTQVVKGVTVADLLALNTVTLKKCLENGVRRQQRDLAMCNKLGWFMRPLKNYCRYCIMNMQDLCLDMLFELTQTNKFVEQF